MRILQANLVDFLVLLCHDVIEIIVVHEMKEHVSGYIPRFGHLDGGHEAIVIEVVSENEVGQKQSRRLAAQSAVTFGAENSLLEKLVEVIDIQKVLGDTDVAQVGGEKPADEGYIDSGQIWRFDVRLGNVEKMDAPDGIGNLSYGQVSIDHLDQEVEFVLLYPSMNQFQNGPVIKIVRRHSENGAAEISR